ncbi:MAG: PEP/pyruvate-binding domain-containing protein, partial [Actinomycetota bacterium]
MADANTTSTTTTPAVDGSPEGLGTGPVVDLRAARAVDVGLVGGKGANLGEMLGVGLPVPDGFAVTAPAYLAAMDQAGIRHQLRELESRAAEAGPDELAELSDDARRLILAHELPAELTAAIDDRYQSMGAGFVAVRSSATAEDTADTSFAGMNETFTNVRGAVDLGSAIRRCWASLYGARVMAYRAEQGLTDEPAIAVVVQQMVAADRVDGEQHASPVGGHHLLDH